MEDEKLIRDRRNVSLWKKYGGIGVMAFLVIAAAVLLIFILIRSEDFSDVVSGIKSALTPVLVGIVLAYLMNPLMVFFENGLKTVVLKHARKITKAKRFCRVVSLILTLVIFIGAITLFLYMLVPKISDTIAGTEEQEGLVDTIPKQAEQLRIWVEDELSGNTKLAIFARDTFDNITDKIEEFVNDTFAGFGFEKKDSSQDAGTDTGENAENTENDPGHAEDPGEIKKLTPIKDSEKEAEEKKTAAENTADDKKERSNKAWDTLTNILKILWDAFGILYDIIIGFIFSIYILLAKDTFGAHAKKLTFAIFKRKNANAIIRITKQCHKKFTGAITGKIIDSIIVGVICYIGMMVMKLPYKELISVIVTVTNVIPFFGPYIGGVPCVFLILCNCFANDNLWPALYFVVFLVVLQQFDCNFLDPKIVGKSVGLSAFWVLFACVVFGALFGLPGMLLGVPTMACVYMIIKEIAEYRLKRKGLDPDTEYYMSVDNVDEQELIVVDPHVSPVAISPEEYAEKMRKEALVEEDSDDTEDDEDEHEEDEHAGHDDTVEEEPEYTEDNSEKDPDKQP